MSKSKRESLKRVEMNTTMNGNIMGLVKATDGTVNATYEYGPFGELLSSTGTMATVNPFKYSTKYTDSETDLYYYGYRYYNSSLGRWISRDPIEEQGGLNLYEFCGNDGVNNWDRLGLQGVILPMDPEKTVYPLYPEIEPYYNWYPLLKTKHSRTSIRKLWTGCCGGKSYNRITHCCRKDVVWGRFDSVATGVKICGAWGHQFNKAYHMWIETPFGAIGVETNDNHPYLGLVGMIGVVNDAEKYVMDSKKDCWEFRIFPCNNDKDKFMNRLENRMDLFLNNKILWEYSVVGNCIIFLDNLIKDALLHSEW